MKKFQSLLICVTMVCLGCETETQVADRVIKKRQLFQTVVGAEIVSLSDEPYGTTTIILSDGRQIVITSNKNHQTKIYPEPPTQDKE